MHADLENAVAAGKLDRGVAAKIDALAPGSHCFHKSWGVGRIVSWDVIGTKLLIDFEDKPAHGMAMKFAAGSLEALPEEHFKVRCFSDREGMKALAADDPVQTVQAALEGAGGSLHLDDLEDMIKGKIVEEGAYKRWWEGAKRKLRADRRFVVPSKRNEPLELRAGDLNPADALVEDFIGSRDLKGKLRSLDAIIKDLSVFEDPATQLEPVVVEINETAAKGLRLHLQQSVELVLGRDEMQAKADGLEPMPEQLTLEQIILEQKDRVGELLAVMPVSRQRYLLKAYRRAFGDDWVTEMISLIKGASLRTIAEVSSQLIEKGAQEELLQYLELGMQQRTLSSDALAWICRERKRHSTRLFQPEISLTVMSSLEKDSLDDESGRSANRLRDLMSDDAELIGDMLRDADINLVRNFARQLMMSSIFEELTRKSLLARVVKLHPDVQDIISGDREETRREPDEEPLVVSWASLEKKRADYDDLVNRRMPQNREDIKIARSYGDLRENFEYKSAKEQQRVLERQKAEMEDELERAQPSDFAEPNTNEVSIGTAVDLRHTTSGAELRYTILGAWDSDPDRNILAYLTGVGQALLGKRVGEQVELTGSEGSGTEVYEVTKISPYDS